MTEKKRGLGRGLQDMLSPGDWLRRDDIKLFYCPIERLEPNPYQPRQVIHDTRMDELILSVQEKGILQPILVSRTETPDHYRILAGERRWQAAKQVGLSEVPVILRDATSAEALELALIENIQRRDLNCIEEALAYQRLHEEFQLTQEEIARRIGKKRSTVANVLRLLQLAPEIQEDVLNERLTMGHARALLAVADPGERLRIRDLILSRHLSVRQTEEMVNKKAKPLKPPAPLDPASARIQERLESRFATRIAFRRKGKRGTITIAFQSDEELRRLLSSFGLEESDTPGREQN